MNIVRIGTTKETAMRLIDTFFPRLCPLCEASLSAEEHVLCSNCDPSKHNWEIQQADALCCERCGEQATTLFDAHLCVACAVWPPAFRYIRSAFRYSERVKNIVTTCKYAGKPALARWMGETLAAFIASEYAFPKCNWDLVVPLPSTKESIRSRGFSQTAFMARTLSKNLSIPWSAFVFNPSAANAPQASLSAPLRGKNVGHAFSIKRPGLCSGRRLLLVDDLVTTGASIQHAALALLNSGALSVDAVTMARSRRFSSLRLQVQPPAIDHAPKRLERVGNE